MPDLPISGLPVVTTVAATDLLVVVSSGVTSQIQAIDLIMSGPLNITLMGNSFNGANELVQLDAYVRLPAVDGSQLTYLPAAVTLAGNSFNGASELLQLDASALVPLANLDASVTLAGNSFNGASELLQLDASALVPLANGPGISGTFTILSLTSLTFVNGFLTGSLP